MVNKEIIVLSAFFALLHFFCFISHEDKHKTIERTKILKGDETKQPSISNLVRMQNLRSTNPNKEIIVAFQLL